MLMCIQNLVKFCPLVLKILSGNKILTSIKGRNSVANLQNLPLYNPNLETINVNALVICNHGPPTPGEGRGIAVEMSGVFTFALSPQRGGNTRDLCYIGKKGGAMKT